MGCDQRCHLCLQPREQRRLDELPEPALGSATRRSCSTDPATRAGIDNRYALEAGPRRATVQQAPSARRALFVTGIAYYLLTQDEPRGDFADLRAAGELEEQKLGNGSFRRVAKDPRVWALFFIYGACFGVELTINNVAALYFHDRFELGLAQAGMIAELFGLMNIFARTMGGMFSDRIATRAGLRGRVGFLTAAILAEGIALMIFSQMAVLGWAIVSLVVFSLFVQMAEGAPYGIVPFINPKALGSVTGIVGAGGNAGAVAAGFLFRSEAISTEHAFFLMGVVVTVASGATLAVRFPEQAEARERSLLEDALAAREMA